MLKVVVSFAMVVFMIRMLCDMHQRIVTMLHVSDFKYRTLIAFLPYMNQNGVPISMAQTQWPIQLLVTELYSSKTF